MFLKRRNIGWPVALLLAACLSQSIWPLQAIAGENYPTRPIRLIVPFGAGGITDVVARLVAQGLSQRIGQSVVVDNRPGAGGGLAAQALAAAEPDAYTLFLGTVGTQVVNKMIYPRLSYDPAAFVPVSLVSNSPYVLAVPASLGIGTLPQLIERARSNPGKLNFGSAGYGSSPHLGLELLKQLAGVEIAHIPFRSGGDAVNTALAGQIEIVFDAIPVIMPQVTSGRLTALAIAQPARNVSVPDLPTTAEQGLEGLQIGSWNALLAPAGTPQARVSRLLDALGRVLADETMLEKFRGLGIEPMPVGRDAYLRHVSAETERWSKVTAAAAIRIN